MDLQAFEKLYELETMIREYQSDLDTLDDFLFKSPESVLQISIKHFSSFDINLRNKREFLKELTMYGSGSVEKDETNYGINARIMAAAVNAMMTEMQAVTAELIEERNHKLNEL
jgi:hypothetical protein